MAFFKKRKIYCVEWHSKWNVYRKDYVKAKDEAHAWAIIKRKNPTIADYCDNIYELNKIERE